MEWLNGIKSTWELEGYVIQTKKTAETGCDENLLVDGHCCMVCQMLLEQTKYILSCQ